MIDVTKEFIISPGGLHLEASLDKEVYQNKLMKNTKGFANS